MRRVSVFVLCISLFCFLSSCSTMNRIGMGMSEIDDPITSAIGGSIASIASASAPITAEQEYYIGRSVAASILNAYTVYDNAPLTEYVNNVVQVLAINSERPELYNGYCVAILDTDQINAFATSGGHIFVTRGLLSCASSEDALAAVLAHEIAHIQLAHGIEAIKSDRNNNAVGSTVVAGLVVMTMDNDSDSLFSPENVLSYGNAINTGVSTLMDKGYSKSQEYDADATALKIMEATGYNPFAMTDMLSLLKERQPHSSGGFSDTHPSAENRLKKVKKELKKYDAIPVPSIRQARFDAAMSTM